VKYAPRLPRKFYRQDTLHVARHILGQRLVHLEAGGERLVGIISEAEAYVGSEDLACHARVGRTQRNATMWGEAGHAYVYFTYGMHWMLNLVTERAGYPAAVLLRAVIPAEGVERMRKRRVGRPDAQLTDGPAKLCQAFGVDRQFDGHDLCGPAAVLFIERGVMITDQSVTSGPRVGLNTVAEPWKSMPWRFCITRSFAKQLQEEIGS
jgi:DNA-3-methyladenine glycosylase